MPTVAPLALACLTLTQPAPAPTPTLLDWKTLEAPRLSGHVQLTLPERFVKAGEAYFDHETPPKWIVFQAVERPPQGTDPSPHYAMYVARLRYDGDIPAALDDVTRISPEGSSNTCAWFEPPSRERHWGKLIYGSTVEPPPQNADTPGYSRDRSRYSWQFPPQMRIVSQTIGPISATALREQHGGKEEGFMPPSAFETLLQPPNGPGYMAECSWSPKGRSLLYTYLDPKTKNPDLWVYDEPTKTHTPLVQADGYDGGPFFSPDGRWVCYRSDRKGDNHLQLMVAELAFDDKDADFMGGRITGVKREVQLTADDKIVSWCPYWAPDMSHLVYATSAVGHANYEVFAIEFDTAKLADPSSLRRTRVTSADGFDGLPVYSNDGKLMMWTSQRGPKLPGEQRPSSQLWIARVNGTISWHAAQTAPGGNARPAEVPAGVSTFPVNPEPRVNP